jgi:beta-glucosidase
MVTTTQVEIANDLEMGQLPLYYNYKNTGRPTMNEPESVFSYYIDEKKHPLYPFGHGLSYSKFEYSNLQLSSNSFAKSGKIEVFCYYKNTGSVAGKEGTIVY